MSGGGSPGDLAGDLGFAMQFNAETLRHFAQLHYLWSDNPQSNNRKGNPIHPP